MNHFAVMEELGQITIFDFLEATNKRLTAGDKVRVTITLESDEVAYNYLTEYCPAALKKPGEIVEVLANNQYLVSFAGNITQFNGSEIERKK